MKRILNFDHLNDNEIQTYAKDVIDLPKEKQSEIINQIFNCSSETMGKFAVALIENVKQCNAMTRKTNNEFNRMCELNCNTLNAALAGSDLMPEERRNIYDMLMAILAMQKEAHDKAIDYNRETRDKAFKAGTIVASVVAVATVTGSVLKAIIKRKL